MHNLKTRILIPLTLTLAILSLGFVVSFYRIQNKHLTAKVIKKLASVENLFAAQLANDAQMMGLGLEMSLGAKKLLKRTHHQKIHRILGVEIYVVLKKKFLNRKNWETGMHLRIRKAAWEQFPLVVMVEQTMEDFPDGLIAFLDEEHDSSMKIEAKVSLNDRRFLNGFMPLEEVSGRKV